MTATADKFSRWEYQNIALAAVSQCAALVHRLAVNGNVPQVELAAAINPLFVLDPENIDEVYPRVNDLSLGLRSLQSVFGNERSPENAELVRYTLGMLLLRNRFMADNAMQRTMRDRLARIERIEPLAESAEGEMEDAALESAQAAQDRIFRQLAGLYQDTISTLSYRIQVQGKVDYLRDEQVANRIRALLLAGIRSAVLWYQLGGRRWRLLVYRKRVHDSASDIRRKLLSSV
ncbi:MAG: high frequency lysogenization protein HflD [Pseudohongiellaceae bacterium]